MLARNAYSASGGSGEFFSVRATIAGPIIEDRLLGRITYGQQEYDGTWRNAHPLADAGISPASDGNLGGFDNDTIAANLTFLATENLSLSLGYFYIKNITMKAISNGSRVMMEALVRALDAAQIKALVAREFPFEQAIEAFEFMDQSSHMGKVIIRNG